MPHEPEAILRPWDERELRSLAAWAGEMLAALGIDGDADEAGNEALARLRTLVVVSVALREFLRRTVGTGALSDAARQELSAILASVDRP